LPLDIFNNVVEFVFLIVVFLAMVIMFLLDIFTNVDISSIPVEGIILIAILTSLLIMLPIIIKFYLKKKKEKHT
jgi:hypothetical protein